MRAEIQRMQEPLPLCWAERRCVLKSNALLGGSGSPGAKGLPQGHTFSDGEAGWSRGLQTPFQPLWAPAWGGHQFAELREKRGGRKESRWEGKLSPAARWEVSAWPWPPRVTAPPFRAPGFAHREEQWRRHRSNANGADRIGALRGTHAPSAHTSGSRRGPAELCSCCHGNGSRPLEHYEEMRRLGVLRSPPSDGVIRRCHRAVGRRG